MNQYALNTGARCRWLNDDGGWEIGSVVLGLDQRPFKIYTPSSGVLTMVRRYHHQDVVAVKEYTEVNEPHPET